MDIRIENERLKVKVHSKGAELFSVVNVGTGKEYMWSGDPAFWSKTSPVLFPIVGTLKDDKYILDGRTYTLSRHGFARDLEFDVQQPANDRAVFTLNSSPDTLEKYPFDFSLTITYSLHENFLNVEYAVGNKSAQDMFFSLGAHPAFKVPLMDGTKYGDNYLEFNQTETSPRWPISDNGLIEENPIPFLVGTSRINLNKELFYKDAIVLKHLKSNVVSLKATTHSHGLDFHFDGFPYLGLWAARNADFVCIEPWCGIADSVGHNQDLTMKEGIEKISPDNLWKRMWKVRFF